VRAVVSLLTKEEWICFNSSSILFIVKMGLSHQIVVVGKKFVYFSAQSLASYVERGL
jgi:hypothetical protein